MTESLKHKTWTQASHLTDLAELQTQLLTTRGLDTGEKISEFFEASWSNIGDPFGFRDMAVACTRIQHAIKNKERIMIFGDFDADGITSTVILVHALQQLGAQVSYRIPERVQDSHGLKEYLLDEIAETGSKLVITCDCGINDQAAVAHAESLGLEVIITDHHQADSARVPAAMAIIHPTFSTHSQHQVLSGSIVAFKLIHGLVLHQEHKKSADFLRPYLELAAIGVIADCIPLVGESRLVAQLGLEALKKTAWPGLKLMLEQARVTTNNIDSNTVGFVIAPRINAASRIGDRLVAVQLFLGNENQHAERVQYLEELNNTRKLLTKEGVEVASLQIDKTKQCQVLFDPTWEPGILGLIASRYCEELGQPIITCTEKVDGTIAASCRSPEGFCMVTGLKKSADFFLHYGGHAGAAGFAAEKDHFESIRQSLQDYFATHEIPTPEVLVSAWTTMDTLNEKLADFLVQLAPFGEGNPLPVFGLKNVLVQAVETVGRDNIHFKLFCEQDGQNFELMAFFADGYMDQITPGTTLDVLCEFTTQYWQGQRQRQLKLVDGIVQ